VDVNNLEEEILNKAGIEMAREIDREVLWGMLAELGWRRVNLDRFTDNKHAVNITHWLTSHCNHAFERSGADFIFESEVDAVNFTLRWQ
jgi:hypothetical protein